MYTFIFAFFFNLRLSAGFNESLARACVRFVIREVLPPSIFETVKFLFRP